MQEMQEYDLIFSLGGSCATTNQLKLLRNLQFCSFPFDWLFHRSVKTMIYFQEFLKTDFKNFLIRENMELLIDEERGNSPLEHQYRCRLSGYSYIHDFNNSIENETEYKAVKKKYSRRLKRLFKYIKKSKKILLILDAMYPIEIDCLKPILDILKARFPNKEFNLICLNFSSESDTIIKQDNILIYKVKKRLNKQCFEEKLPEWSFLDKIKLSEEGCLMQKKEFDNENNFLMKFKKLKRGLGIYLFPRIFNILKIRLLIFGLRFDFCIGEVID